MKIHLFTITLCLVASPLIAQIIEVTAPFESQVAFPGTNRTIQVRLRNSGENDIETHLSMKVYQASSATVIPVGPVRPWKSLTIKAGQTVLEEFKTELPAVRARSRFIVQCVNDDGLILGRLNVFVYPPDLLKELIGLTRAKGIDLLDPDARIAPVLKRLEIPFSEWAFDQDQSEPPTALLVLGPFSEEHPLTSKMKKSIDTLVRSGRRLVCLNQTSDEIYPLSEMVTIFDAGHGRLVTAPPALIVDLDRSPASQLALIRLVKLAATTNRLAQAGTEP